MTNPDLNKDRLIKELLAENEKLLDELLMAQIRIEQKNNELEDLRGQSEAAGNEFYDKILEFISFKCMDECQKKIRDEIQEKNAVKLGLNTKANLFKLMRKNSGKKFVENNYFVRESARKGNSAEKITEIINKEGLSPSEAANAYTELARVAEHKGLKAELAFRAWVLHPKPYRLKWLAFRCHENNDPTRAAFFLDMLPKDTPMTDSEKQHSEQIREADKKIHLYDARAILNEMRPKVNGSTHSSDKDLFKEDVNLIKNY